MTDAVGTVAIKVVADATKFNSSLKSASNGLADLSTKGTAMGRNLAKAATVAVAAIVAVAGAALQAGRAAASYAREIDNLSKVSNSGTTEFQKMAVAVNSVNISQEKLADILKDVNDRIGDFVSTGGGPMRDFFENIAPLVGVTADNFAQLSGPEALQLYYTSLERANLNQAEMTFYLEAMASDTSALIPLLRNGGAEMRRLGDEAQKAGQILDKDMIAAGVELDKVLGDAARTIKQSFNKAILENADAIATLSNFISETLLPAMGWVLEKIGEIVGAITGSLGKMREWFGMAFALEGYDGPRAVLDKYGENPSDPDRPESPGMLGYVDDNGSWVDYGDDAAKPFSGTGSKGSKGSKGGGKGRGSAEADLKRLKEQFASEAELLEMNYQETLEKLREFRETKLKTEEEFNALEEQIHADHLQAVRDMELAGQRERLQAITGAFGDLASLMQTNSKKLFAIGKAAATAEAIVSGYQSAVDAWQKGMKIGGPPLAAAFTAASLAKTGALIAGIQSQTIGGSGGGGTSGTPAGITGGTTSTSQQTINIAGIDPSSLYSGKQINGIIDAFRDQGLKVIVT